MSFTEYQFIEVSLPCTDAAAQERWWTKMFDAETLFRGQMMGQPFTRMRVCGVSLIFRQQPAHPVPPGIGEERLFENHLGLRVHDLEAAIEDLQARGAQFALTPAMVRRLQKQTQTGNAKGRAFLETTYIRPPLTAERIAAGEFKHDVAILLAPDNIWVELNQIREPDDTRWYPGSE